MSSYCSYSRQIHIVINWTLSRVQSRDSFHFLICKNKIEDIQILYHSFLAHGLGYNHDVALVEPAKHDRPHAFTVPCSDFFQHRVIENVVLPFGERSPCFMLDALLLQKRIGGLLLKKRVSFQLIHSRSYLIVQKKILQSFVRKARHTNSANTALFIQPFHCPPCRIIIPIGLCIRYRSR